MLVVGATRTYSLRTLAPWLGSFRHVRRDEDRQVLVAVGDAGLERGPIKKLGVEVVDVEKETPHAVNAERWLHLARLLPDLADANELVLLSDTRDAYFQFHPESPIADTMGAGSVLIGAENIRFRDSSFNIDPIDHAVGAGAERFYDRPVLCCGLVAGRAGALARLAELTYATCTSRMSRTDGSLLLNGLIDQSAVALVLDEQADVLCPVVTTQEDGVFLNGAVDWVRSDPQHGRRIDARELTVLDGQVRTRDGRPVAVVHQYDRDEALRASVAQKWAHIA